MASGEGTETKPGGFQKLALLALGVLLLALFVGFAIAEGIGDPSIPSGDVALVQDAPPGTGEISQAKFEHALEQSAAQAGLDKAPKPGDDHYKELKEVAMNAVFESIWLQGLGEELGIVISEDEVAAELKKLKKENFSSEAEFQKFLKEAKYTREDVNERVKLQKLSSDIQEQLESGVPAPSQAEIEEYYEAGKASQFTEKPKRDVRLIVNKDLEKVEKAVELLRANDAPENWTKVVEKYSEDPATKETGGMQKGLQENVIEEPLNEAIFSAAEGQVEGPIKVPRGFTAFEVESPTIEEVKPLKSIESQIQTTLAQRTEQEFFNQFVADFNLEWGSRTFCAEDYVTERCANFSPDAHPASAPPACYEAEPKGGRSEACPAPVFQLIPAQPGSVTLLEPQGKPLAQHPVPVGGEVGTAAEVE